MVYRVIGHGFCPPQLRGRKKGEEGGCCNSLRKNLTRKNFF